MNPEDYYITVVRGTGTGAVQWSLPIGARAILRPDAGNANSITISDDPTGVSGVFTLIAPVAGTGISDQVILPRGYPKPLYIFGNAGDDLIIWTMPCGISEVDY
jgi:hypothetical protein